MKSKLAFGHSSSAQLWTIRGAQIDAVRAMPWRGHKGWGLMRRLTTVGEN